MRKEMSKRSKFYASHLGGGRGMWRMVKYNYIVFFLAAISMLYGCDTMLPTNGPNETNETNGTSHGLFDQNNKVGSVDIDITADHKLSVTAELVKGKPNENFSFKVQIFDELGRELLPEYSPPLDKVKLATDKDGKGNATFLMELPSMPDDAEAIYVKVVVGSSSCQYTCSEEHGVRVPLK